MEAVLARCVLVLVFRVFNQRKRVLQYMLFGLGVETKGSSLMCTDTSSISLSFVDDVVVAEVNRRL